MPNFKWFAYFVLAATIASTLTAETRCPGNVASLPYRVVNRHQIIVAVSINRTGPYSFLLDTGTGMTMINPALAGQLHLAQDGEARVASAGMSASASFSQVGLVEAGPHAVPGMKVLVYDLSNLQATGLNIQGVPGEDFLGRFDLLIDNAHGLLCMDETGAMRPEVKGQHVPLAAPARAANDAIPNSLIISVKLSDGMRPVRLKLDSGANVPFLYNTSDYMALGLFHGASLSGGGANGTRVFTALPPQTMKIGSVEISRVQFVTLAGAKKDAHTADFDGLLTLGLFRRVFIDHADRFAVLDPM